MKLHRALALAAATAVIAPAAVLGAPAAFADTAPPAPSESASESADPQPSASVSATTTAGEHNGEDGQDGQDGENTEAAPSTTPSGSATPSASVTPSTTATPSETPSPTGEPSDCATSDLEFSVDGMPGRIARGSGWHPFTMNVHNASRTTMTDVGYFAGAGYEYAGEEYLFDAEDVALQYRDLDTGKWTDFAEDGQATGYLGRTDELRPGYEVNIPMRIDVRSGAPLGASYTFGFGYYTGDQGCSGAGDATYRFTVVKSGTGAAPQEGGRAPVPTTRPDRSRTSNVPATLAETGSSSVVPVLALAGGVAVVLGAGTMFVVRRRGNGDAVA